MTAQSLHPMQLHSERDIERLHLRLLGEVELFWGGAVLPLPGPKILALLVYLHLKGQASREELGKLFWPTKSNALQNVRQALTTLRKLSGADAGGVGWLCEQGGMLSVAGVSDVSELHRLSAEGRHAEALALTQLGGELLGRLQSPSPAFSNWLEEERAALHAAQWRALHACGLEQLQAGEFDGARRCLMQALYMEPLGESEATYRALMTLEHRAGRTAQALEAFEQCRRMLEQELDAQPSPETQELLRQIEGRGAGTQGGRGALLFAGQSFPLEEDPLFGREAELEQLLTLLQGGPAEEGSRVLLHGMGGLGKTRLASAAAQRWLERLQAPEGDKVLWLEVGSGAAPEILGRIDAQLERRPHESRQAALARSGVSLVVLENAAGTYALQQTLAALPEELPALVTSRLRFPGLSRLELTRLSREAALELLEFHLTAGNENMGSAPPPHPEALCALLGDHPFALRLAARTLASAPDTSVIQALYAAPQDTIRVLLEQSLSTVSAREYEVYLALDSLEAPHSTPELLTYLLERPSEEIERALWELTGCGLLTREAHPGADAVTYRMHDLTWRVAREHRTHLPHHLRATTLQYAAAHTDRADLLAADLSHLLAAASSAPPDELKTLMAFWLGGNYIAARGFPAAQLHLLDSAITAAEQTGDWDAASLLNGKYADISQALLGDQSAAIARLQRGAKQAEYCGQLERQAVQLSLAGQMGAASGLPEAAAWLETASALAGASGNPAVQARVWGQQAITEARQQNFIEAQRLLERAAAALEMYLAGTGKPEEDAAASPQQKAQQKAQQGSGVDSVLSRSG